MRIESGEVKMNAQRTYHSKEISYRRFVMKEQGGSVLTDGGTGLQTEGEGKGEEQEETAKDKSMPNAAETIKEWQEQFLSQRTNFSARNVTNKTYSDLRQLTIQYLFELLFAKESWRDRVRKLQGTADEMTQTVMEANHSVQMTFQTRTLNYCQETYFEEQESVNFSTIGQVKTSDGRRIDFNVQVGMSRDFARYYQEDLEMVSFQLCDPLVINLDTDAAAISDQTFYFDLDQDGEKEEVAKLAAGSGFLALDWNGDGRINDGSELFGTKSGDGFADLAQYDEDGNGWIDEGDSIFSKLKIMTYDEAGNQLLYRVAEKGVGAICLQQVTTDFSQKNGQGAVMGAVRKTGIFLYENGCAGTIQHVDLAKYEQKA